MVSRERRASFFSAELRSSIRRLGGSLASCEAVLKLNPNSAVAWLKSAEIYERRNRLEEARDCLERALKLEPKSESARLKEGILLTRERRLDEAAQSLCDLLQSGLADREVHWKAGHQLALVMDKMGDFSGAAQVWEASKQGVEVSYASEIKKAREAFELKASLIRKLTDDLTPARIKSWREAGRGLIKPSLLAGHPRSGTTLLETILDRHGMLVSLEETTCMENEVSRSVFGSHAAKPKLFEARFLDGIPPHTCRRAGDFYQKSVRQFLGGNLEGRMVLDKNPMMTHFLGVAPRFFSGTEGTDHDP
ncbi:MAG: tetratricopeptide repeat protein [Akkermansiaceae bacterium]|nr:tetratricopeptide repeat protein [Akkermansiaceae bacterium]